MNEADKTHSITVESLSVDLGQMKRYIRPNDVIKSHRNTPTFVSGAFLPDLDVVAVKANDTAQGREEVRALVILGKGELLTKKIGKNGKPDINYEYGLVQTTDGNLLYASKSQQRDQYFAYYNNEAREYTEQTEVIASSYEDLAKEAKKKGHKNIGKFQDALETLDQTIEEALNKISELFFEKPEEYFFLMRLLIVANGGYIKSDQNGQNKAFFLKQERDTKKGIGGLSIVYGNMDTTSGSTYSLWKIPGFSEVTNERNIDNLKGLNKGKIVQRDSKYLSELEANEFIDVILETSESGPLN